MKSKFFAIAAILAFSFYSNIESQTKSNRANSPSVRSAPYLSPTPTPTPLVAFTPRPSVQDPQGNPVLAVLFLVGLIVAIVFLIRWLIAYNRKQEEENERKREEARKIEEEKIVAMTTEQREQYLEQKRKAQETAALAISSKAVKQPTRLIEYRRTCQVCEKVWHSLVSREKQIISSQKSNTLLACGGAMQSCGSCGSIGSGTQAQGSRNVDANKSELSRLQSCPQCSSANYREEIIEHVQ